MWERTAPPWNGQIRKRNKRSRNSASPSEGEGRRFESARKYYPDVIQWQKFRLIRGKSVVQIHPSVTLLKSCS